MWGNSNSILAMYSEKIRISLVDDHKMFREGLKFVLSDIEEAEVISESSNGAEFLEQMGYETPDLVLMDISMPILNGIDTTREALKMNPNLKVIALSMFGDEEYYSKMIQAGAKGFIIKESGTEELAQAITEVMDGGVFFSQKLLQKIVMNNNPFKPHEAVSDEIPIKLTKRETEVLRLICAGFPNAEIADKLNISLRTVEGHRSKLITRAGVKNSVQLVLYVLRHKLLDIN